MAAPIGNQFWKVRAKHGRDKIFSTPEQLRTAAYEYFEWVDSNPLKKQEVKVVNIGDYQSDTKIVETDLLRPYTLKNLCLFLGVHSIYFSDFKSRLKPDESKLDKEFSEVIAHVEEVIYSQKFEGASIGAFNPNIIARDLGLADKSEVNANVKLGTEKENYL